MSAEANKALVRRFVDEVWNGKNVDAFDTFHAAMYTKKGEPHTAEQNKQGMREVFAIFPDLQETIEDILAEGDKVAYRWVIHGTNQTTGKRHVFRGITINRIADGKIVDDWYSAEEAIEE